MRSTHARAFIQRDDCAVAMGSLALDNERSLPMPKDVLSRLLGFRIRPQWSAAIRTMGAACFLSLGVNAMGNWLGYWHGNYSSSRDAWNFIEVNSNTTSFTEGAVAERCLSHWIVMLPVHWMLMSFFATLKWQYQKRTRSRHSKILEIPLPFVLPGVGPCRDLYHVPPFMTSVFSSSCAAVACTLHSMFTFLTLLNSIQAASLSQTPAFPVSVDSASMPESAICLTSQLTALFASCPGLFAGFVVYQAISANGLRKELAGVAVVIALQVSILLLSFELPNSDPLSRVVFVVFHAIAQFGSLILLIFLFHLIEDV